ncbi:MAG: hypothetical protein JJU02_13735 [Cryomorphaceae bacterium]|nr:hypothetical protein [Cryomorphaceae bacterium]
MPPLGGGDDYEKAKGEIHGNFQSDFQYYFRDVAIDPTGEFFPEERFLAAGFTNLIYTQGNFQAGIRYENYQNNLLGLPEGFRGQGIPYRFARFSKDGLDVTVGNFYEQFGSGMIFRSFEERGLGLDNAMDGVRLRYSPFKGLYLKGMVGRQRLYFETTEGIVRGGDAELNFNETFKKMQNSKWLVTTGASFVSKFEPANDPFLELPQNVGAYGGRLLLQNGGFALSSEYTYKINDPSADNNYIFKNGEGFLTTVTYSRPRLGVMLAFKRLDDMSFRSQRDAGLIDAQINFLPPTTKLHTYTLPALYPYAVQPTGEISRQAEITYTFKRKSFLGGKYGTTVAVNFSDAYSLDKDLEPEREIVSAQNPDEVIGTTVGGTRGYTADFFQPGPIKFFQDFNVEIRKTINRKWKTTLSYFNFHYNQEVLERGVSDRQILLREGGANSQELIYIQAFVAEVLYKIKPRHSLRTEIQGMFTEQDRGDWAMLLFEYSVSPGWFFAVQNSFNYGNPDPDARLHYTLGSVGYTLKTTRFQLTYGRQMEGIFCVGGICRVVPPSNGVTLTVTSNF